MHVYQRAEDNGVIFHTTFDRLVYYSTASVMARKYHVSVLAISLMYTHIHQSIIIDCSSVVSKYIQHTTSSFVRAYNNWHERDGSLFERRFRRSIKRTPKAIRTNIAYVNNNHTEKQLCDRSIDARWNFLAYYRSPHPFSAPMDKETMSKRVKKAIKSVDKFSRTAKPLRYVQLEKLFKGLSPHEEEQVTDYVIGAFSFVDIDGAIAYYGDFDTMLLAFDSNTGSEYAINEDHSSDSDTPYTQMTLLLNANNAIDRIFTMGESEKSRLMMECFLKTNAKKYQINKMFHTEQKPL